MVSGHTEDALYPQNRGSEKIRLEPDPVPVAAGHLEDRLKAVLHGYLADSKRADAHHSSTVVSNIDSIKLAFSTTPYGGASLFISVPFGGRPLQ